LFGFITAPFDDMDPKREDILGAQPQPRPGILKRDAVRRKPGFLHRLGRRIAIVGTFKRLRFIVRLTILPFSGGRERERSDRPAHQLQRRVGQPRGTVRRHG